MKKSLLSMFLCVFVILPVFLTGCSGNEGTIQVEQTRASAMTLTLYSIVENGTTDTAIQAVEDALNKITENELNTHLVLKFFTEDEYSQIINGNISAIQADMELQNRLSKASETARKAARSAGYSVAVKAVTAAAAVNGDATAAVTAEADETQINEYGIPDVVYPDEINGQLDIFLINSADMYQNFIDKKVLSELDGELSLKSKILKNYIYPSLLNSANVAGHTYAIPNNHMVGEYTYMLVNKSIAEKYGYSESTFKSAASLYDSGFLRSVSAREGGGTVLMLNNPECTIDYATGNEGLLGTYITVPMSTTILSYPPEIVFGLPTYKSLLVMKNEYKKSIAYGDMIDYKDKSVASAFLKGSYADMQRYKGDYYVTVVDAPTYSMEDICSSMYAVSAYSVNLSRSMEIIQLLTMEPDVVNLLAYGIENVNYNKKDNSDAIELINNEEGNANYYKMKPDYVGNQYKRYLTTEATEFEKAIAADNWSAAKSQNLASVQLPYANFNINTSLVPTYVEQETEIEEGDETTTEQPTTTGPKEYMSVKDMLTGLDALYIQCMRDIENYNGKDPDTGASMSISEYLDALTERLKSNEYVSQALDVANSASVISQYNTYTGQ